MRPKLVLIYSTAFVLILVGVGMGLSGMSSTKKKTADDYCSRDKDCGCGKHIESGKCFVGKKGLVEASSDCFEYCFQGVGMEIGCVDHQCRRAYVGKD